ncbi:MAG: GTP-binding protein, partial [Calditrichota bacterium]
MKIYSGDKIRNIGIGGHSGCGKTSLVEALLFNMGEITRMGKVEDGNTVSDFNANEIERQVSINTSLMHGEWKDTKINLVDTPGFSDFFGGVVSGMRAADVMMIVVSASDGVEVGTERLRELADEYEMPRFYVINKLDRENVSFMDIYNELRERFGKKLTIAEIPLTSGPGFHRVVDILKKKLYTYEQDGSGKFKVEDLPEDILSKVAEIRNNLVEAVAESDDELLEKYFEEGELSEDELISGFKKAVLNRTIVPVLATAATGNVGASSLLDFIAEYLPAASDMPPAQMEDGSERVRNDSESLSGIVFATMSEEHVGELSYVKIASGVLKSGDEAINVNYSKSERIGQMYILNGKSKKSVDSVHAGDICALVKLKSTHTGD